MAAIAGLPPKTLRDLLLEQGWIVIDETENMWLLAPTDDPHGEPVPIPKHCDTVDPEIMDWVAHRSPGLTKAVMGAVRKHVSQTP